MAKIILLVLALASVALAKPMGGGVVTSHGSHISTHMVAPHFGLYGLGLYPGVIGHSISSHSVHGIGHGIGYGGIGYGYGFKGIGLYPGLGLGYGFMG